MPTPEARIQRRRLRSLVHTAQDSLVRMLGVAPGHRVDTVTAMLAANVRRAPSYWIQLFLATSIATLGLALDSTAVIIGAMLMSPLMGPLVELGMGFAVGSSLLVIRAALWIGLSVAGGLATAVAVTLALPFHEVTHEIASRTTPTLLDLLIAALCALMANYTTIRQTSDTTAAAAGTAIGIALVPPLCVAGFGLGTGNMTAAGGAALLFTANFTAIMVVAVLAFLLLGYARVDAASLEQEFDASPHRRSTHAAKSMHGLLARAFGSQYGLVMRLLVPSVFLLVVYVPLSRALDAMAWQVRVRNAIRQILTTESPQAIQTAAVVDRNTVVLRLLIVGSPEDASRLEGQLTTEIAAVSGVTPSVTVVAVPDAAALAARQTAETRTPTVPPPRPGVDFARSQRQIADALATAWPASGGELVGWSLAMTDSGIPALTIRYLGPQLGPAAEQLLAQAISTAVGSTLTVKSVALPVTPVVATAGAAGEAAWLAATRALLDETLQVPDLRACIEGPIDVRGGAGAHRETEDALRDTVLARDGRLTLTEGPSWAVRIGRTCEKP
jgi:uncharacterized hydrophobic protein (TIGR00271 family)